jgi:hypothetical protein
MALYFLLLLLLLTWCETAAAIDTAFAHSPQHILTSQSSVPASKSSFGQAVAISENFAVVGDGHEDAVRVHIYKKSQEGPTMGSWSHFQEIDSDLTNPLRSQVQGTAQAGELHNVVLGVRFKLLTTFFSSVQAYRKEPFFLNEKVKFPKGFSLSLFSNFNPPNWTPSTLKPAMRTSTLTVHRKREKKNIAMALVKF